MQKIIRHPLFIAFLLGLASVASFAPLAWFPLIFPLLAGLYALLEKTLAMPRRARQGAMIGWAFGLGLFLGGVSWVYVSLSHFGGMPAPVAALSTLLLCAFLALYPALVGALFVRFAPPAPGQRRLFFAALWTLVEWLRGWLLTGFPWLAVGYTQVPSSPLAGFAPVIGVYGVSLLTVLLATLLLDLWQRVRGQTACAISSVFGWCPLQPLLLIVLLLLGGGLLRGQPWTQPVGEPISVVLLQGNIEQDSKWLEEGYSQSLRGYYALMRDNPAQLTILPEAAFPIFQSQLPEDYLDILRGLAARQNGSLLFGIVTGDLERYANSAILTGAQAEQQYSKSHLVPFGEFTPKGFSWFMDLVNIPMSDFTPGADRQPPFAILGQKVAVNICYEDAFGEEIIRALPEASLLVNLSNVAWFGDSLAPRQHLQIAQMRALETGRMMLRATNTGMTAVIGHDGRINAALRPYTRAALRAEAQGYQGSTPYVRWGNLPLIALCLLGCAVMAWQGRRRCQA